ncbi:hypothetical protein L198_04540 [Cryptococcus wingfieldii CBS 7118]|uniref:Retrovirus-related Pol polyprotein from transposon TNT 1-94-like beta-barrel domain-containing protein n=1 Tax=Cryptococcus wingfieldii CBS 7118 TaxID=1295528 RepID=A0A1E3J7K8_9TREE|nr:hypothetical protein L198_04540 [Cryptococcus wingfieldii CBS 7118]ODN95921.1 hypothetical protein L198_04540 [Cryptococcus wingfieldii CBS 7118]
MSKAPSGGNEAYRLKLLVVDPARLLWFTTPPKPLLRPVCITVADGSTLVVAGSADVCLLNHEGVVVQVRDVYYVPDLRFNLLSSARLMAIGATVSLHDYAGVASLDGATIFRLQYRFTAWILDVSKVPSPQVECPPRALQVVVAKLSPPAARSGKAAPLEIWHRRLSHLGIGDPTDFRLWHTTTVY